VPPPISDHARSLECARDDAHARPVNAQHKGQELLGYLKVIAFRPVMGHEQLAGEALFQIVTAVARGGLRGLRVHRFQITKHSVPDAALMHAPAPDEVLKNTFANFAFEHYEIAAYKSLLTLADLIGQPSAISMLERSLAEEEAMAKWIADHLEETTTTFVRRTEAGETAGV
jgi:hypothetical protein